MKKSISLCLAILLMTGVCRNVLAAARNVSNAGRDYVVAAPALNSLSCGVYGDNAQNDITVSSIPTRLETSKIMAYLGVDVLPWLTPYVTVGTGSSKFDDGPSKSQGVYGLGIQLKFLDHEIPDPGLLEDRLRLNANAEYTWRGAADWMGEDLKWQELNASLTVGIVNDVNGNALFIPDSIAIYCGPIYTALSGSEIGGDGRTDFGFCAGLEVFYTKRVAFYGQINKQDNDGYSVGLNIHF